MCAFFFLLLSVSKKRNIEKMLALPYSYNWENFLNKINEKRSLEYKMMDPEYVTRQIDSRTAASFETISSFDSCTVSKILICFSLIKRFLNDHRRFSSHLQVSILHRVAPVKVF